jgi:hypothetical protein
VWHAVRYAFVPEKRAAMIKDKRAGLVSVPFDRRQATRFESVAAAARRRPGPFLFFFGASWPIFATGRNCAYFIDREGEYNRLAGK